MDLGLPPAPSRFKSKSQIARVTTERWAAENFYCAACGTDLTAYPTGTKVYDFYSRECGENFQLKSARRPLTGSILGGKYSTTMESLMKDRFPSLILLHYDHVKWEVADLSLVHRACITTSCIRPRTPLTQSALRAGWEGYTIRLGEIPAQGRIEVVTNGHVRAKSEILSQWKQTDGLLGLRPEQRGWLADVLLCVERCFTTFTLANVYAFEAELAVKHRDNHHIREKIRQQLQLLRNLGLIEFQGSGVYRHLRR
jgi:type II restriction enzyme